jgi:hypothetical protein
LLCVGERLSAQDPQENADKARLMSVLKPAGMGFNEWYAASDMTSKGTCRTLVKELVEDGLAVQDSQTAKYRPAVQDGEPQTAKNGGKPRSGPVQV